MLIGICDDIQDDRMVVKSKCENYFAVNEISHEYILFRSAEEVLAYCSKVESKKIDILFLDIEMDGLSGIDLMTQMLKQYKIWKIAFVTSHFESVYSAFSSKSIGYVVKPAPDEKIAGFLKHVIQDMNENVVSSFDDVKGKEVCIHSEDIGYIKAAGSYSELYGYTQDNHLECISVLSKKIGTIEHELKKHAFVRVHRSYIVNLANVLDVGQKVVMRDGSETIPVGRLYKNQLKSNYLSYGKSWVKKRL